jgi:hypothetical protein
MPASEVVSGPVAAGIAGWRRVRRALLPALVFAGLALALSRYVDALAAVVLALLLVNLQAFARIARRAAETPDG